MQSGFMKAICQIGIFMICAQAIVHFRPKASYEKYLKMLLSAMIMIQIMSSIVGIFSAGGKEQLSERIAYFTDSLSEEMQQAADDVFFTGENSELEILGERPGGQEDTGQQISEIGEISVQITPVETICLGEMQDE